jgi:hypothetical protein
MAGFGDAPLVGPASELQLTIDGRAVPHDDVLAQVAVLARAGARVSAHRRRFCSSKSASLASHVANLVDGSGR